MERRGAFTGGHHDAKRSKLMLMHTINECGERLHDLEIRRRRAADEAGKLDQQISGCLGELEKLRAQQSHLKGKAELLRAEEKASRGDLAAKQQLIVSKVWSLERRLCLAHSATMSPCLCFSCSATVSPCLCLSHSATVSLCHCIGVAQSKEGS